MVGSAKPQTEDATTVASRETNLVNFMEAEMHMHTEEARDRNAHVSSAKLACVFMPLGDHFSFQQPAQSDPGCRHTICWGHTQRSCLKDMRLAWKKPAGYCRNTATSSRRMLAAFGCCSLLREGSRFGGTPLTKSEGTFLGEPKKYIWENVETHKA